MFSHKLPDLYAILDFQTCLARNLDPRVIVKSWCDSGIQLIQIRAKQLTDLNYWVFAETIRDCCDPYDTTLIINARPDIAQGLELDGVHLPSSGLPILGIREAFPNLLVFASCHNEFDIERRKLADAITLSPLFSPTSKPTDSRETLGLHRYNKLSKDFEGKVYGLGGIDRETVRETRQIPIASLGFLTEKNALENAKILLSRDSL